MTQFDLEQQIMTCWQVCDDLKAVNHAVLEKSLTPDQISNIISGMAELYQLKFEVLFELFEKLLKENHERGVSR
jgi:hypothetical protein